ncbi:outer membrane protein [Taklimakanibacter lacteus]|uniref:outer membrane protein n=1 Tax=Taklimakanibacter lacteus TaxID=2268456 RepID=UPI000E65F920
MLRRLLLASASMVLALGGAHAADVVEEPVAVYDWSGPYIGGSIGYIQGNFDVDATPFGGPTWEDEPDGIYLGGLVGFNYQMDNLVLGLEADIGWTDANDKTDLVGFEPLASDDDIDYLATLRARIGWAMDNILIFATGGVGLLGTDLQLNNEANPTDTENDHFGYVLGGGLEWGATENISVRADYLYGNFETKTSTNSFGSVGELDPEIHLIRGSVIFHF